MMQMGKKTKIVSLDSVRNTAYLPRKFSALQVHVMQNDIYSFTKLIDTILFW